MPAPGILKSTKLWKTKKANSISWQVGEKARKMMGARHVPKLTESEKELLEKNGAIEAMAKPTETTAQADKILKKCPRPIRPRGAEELLRFLADRGIS